MRTGVSYMGHHNPQHLEIDIAEMASLELDDVLVAAQENDFVHFTGKLDYTPRIAKEHGLRPVAIFWGVLNLFGGGRSSQFLLEHPEAFQVDRNGAHRPAGCYVNPVAVSHIQRMIDTIAACDFEGYFVDEPTPLRECYCPSCRDQYAAWYGGELLTAPAAEVEAFRRRCVIDYVIKISDYCKRTHPNLETICCLMPHDDAMWAPAAAIESLDNLGTDLYWANNTRDVEEMIPPIDRLSRLCRDHGKTHHEWLQCWHVKAGNEHRIRAQGEVLIRQNPDALYVWAWKGQVGTTESCDRPSLAWDAAAGILRKAKEA